MAPIERDSFVWRLQKYAVFESKQKKKFQKKDFLQYIGKLLGTSFGFL